jgi:REP element-mobilizing transposase RayT
MEETMSLYKNKYRIESTRLKGYNYSNNGAYFVTICTQKRQYFFGSITENHPNKKIATQCWLDLPNHYPNCFLDVFVVMPNHVHGIIIIDNAMVETGFKPVSTAQTSLKPVSTTMNKKYSLSEIIRGFKTFSARKINESQNTQGTPFWQPRFYDRIIRNEKELNGAREYIMSNPFKWDLDKNNIENLYM